MDEEVVIAKAVVNKKPDCLYYLNKDGDLIEKKKLGLSHSYKRKQHLFTDLNLTFPRVLLKAYISRKIREVKKFGKSGAFILMPKDLIGMKGRVIIIPESELEEEGLNIF